MQDQNNTVETKVETAVTQPKVEAPINASEVDYEKVIAEKDAALKKVAEEKENYRKGMLKAKGKLPEESNDDTPPKNWREEARAIAREEYLTTQEAQLQAEKDQAMKDLFKQNQELKLAIKNRGQVGSPSGSGSNEERVEIRTDNFFSPDQIAALKAKGWDDKKIEAAKKNMSAPTAPQTSFIRK